MADKNWTIAIEAKDRASAALGNVNNQLMAVNSSLTNMGGLMKLVAGAMILAPFAIATKSAMDFQSAMAEVRAVTFATNEEMQKLSEVARKAGIDLGFTATESANAMYYLGSAGYDANQTMQSLNGTLLLARATNTDLAFVTSNVVTVLGQFNMAASEAGRVADVFASGIANSQLTMERLSESLSYVGPIAASANLSLEDLVTGLALMSREGHVASMAGTAFRMAIARLLNPTAEMKTVLDQLGLSVKDIDLKTNSFIDVMTKLRDVGIDTSQAIELFGIRAAPAMQSLLNQVDDWDELRDKIAKTGTASEMAAVQMDTVQGQMKQVKAILVEIGIQIGNNLLPVISIFLKIFKGILNLFDSLPEPVKKAITIFGVMTGVFITLKSVAGMLGLSMAVLNSQIALIPVIIIGAVAAVYILIKAFQKVRNEGMSWGNAIKTTLSDIKNTIGNAFSELRDTIGLTSEDFQAEIDEMASSMEEGMGAMADAADALDQALMTTDERVSIFGDNLEETQKKLLNGETVFKGVLESVDSFKARLVEAGLSMEYLNNANITNSITLDSMTSKLEAFGEKYLDLINEILEANGEEKLSFDELKAKIEEYEGSIDSAEDSILSLIDTKRFLGDSIEETKRKLWNQEKVVKGKNETMEQFRRRLIAAGVSEEMAAQAAQAGSIQLSTQADMVNALGNAYNKIMSQIGGNIASASTSFTDFTNAANSSMITLNANLSAATAAANEMMSVMGATQKQANTYGAYKNRGASYQFLNPNPIAFHLLPNYQAIESYFNKPPSIPIVPPNTQPFTYPYGEGYKAQEQKGQYVINVNITGSKADAREIEKVFTQKIEPRLQRTIKNQSKGM